MSVAATVAGAPRRFGAGRSFTQHLAFMLAVLVVWQVLHWIVGPTALASPSVTVRHAADLLVSPRFWTNTQATGLAFVLAVLIAVLGGVLIGLTLGSSKLLAEAGEPVLISLYTVPKVAFFPIILLIFGIGLSAQVTFAFIHGIIPIALFSLNAVKNTPNVYMKCARILNMSKVSVWTRIIIPSSIPEIFTGIRIGVALTFIGTILAEMYGSHRGLGFMLMNAMGTNDAPRILALALLITVFAVCMSWGLLYIDKRLHRRL
jgi:NitT/TauT family transport system permease protein